jgi:hypothetical protein
MPRSRTLAEANPHFLRLYPKINLDISVDSVLGARPRGRRFRCRNLRCRVPRPERDRGARQRRDTDCGCGCARLPRASVANRRRHASSQRTIASAFDCRAAPSFRGASASSAGPWRFSGGRMIVNEPAARPDETARLARREEDAPLRHRRCDKPRNSRASAVKLHHSHNGGLVLRERVLERTFCRLRA